MHAHATPSLTVTLLLLLRHGVCWTETVGIRTVVRRAETNRRDPGSRPVFPCRFRSIVSCRLPIVRHPTRCCEEVTRVRGMLLRIVYAQNRASSFLRVNVIRRFILCDLLGKGIAHHCFRPLPFLPLWALCCSFPPLTLPHGLPPVTFHVSLLLKLSRLQ
jgi:hypothetical protein